MPIQYCVPTFGTEIPVFFCTVSHTVLPLEFFRRFCLSTWSRLKRWKQSFKDLKDLAKAPLAYVQHLYVRTREKKLNRQVIIFDTVKYNRVGLLIPPLSGIHAAEQEIVRFRKSSQCTIFVSSTYSRQSTRHYFLCAVVRLHRK